MKISASPVNSPLCEHALFRFFLAAVAAMLLGAGPASAEPYRLSLGDRLLVRIIPLEGPGYVSTVDTAGEIRLPYLGTHQALGRTLDELAQDIALSVAGRQIRSVQGGVATMLVLDEQDIFLDIETYRPVTMTGAIADPGPIPFEPGLTVRAAIGAAGGLTTSGGFERFDQQANFRTRQAEARETEAWLASELWRIHVLLEDLPSDTPIDGPFQVVADRLDSAEIDNLRRLVDGARAVLDRGLEDKEARIILTQKRIDFLRQAFAQFQTASEIEEERLQDILTLANRGLTTASALDSAREGALNASSRVLTTQADLASAERDLQTLIIEKRGLQEDFVQTLQDEQAKTERTYDEARARLDSLNRELALGALVETGSDAAPDVRILLYRQNGTEEATMEVSPSQRLRPGDVIEVMVSFD